MPTKATDFQKGVSKGAGRESSIPPSGSAPRGSRGTAKPLRHNQMHGGNGRNERHASSMADDGGSWLGQPASGETKQYK